MITQQEINNQQRDMNGFIKILPFDKEDPKGRDMLEAFKNFDKILKSDSQKQNISFNKHFYDVVATAKNNLISGKVVVNNTQDINNYMIGLRNEILNNTDKFQKQLQQTKNERERVAIYQPKNPAQQAIDDTFQSFYHNCVKPYREVSGKQLAGDFYKKWQDTKNYMVSNEVPMDNVKKYLDNTLSQLKQGVYDKVENSTNKDYASQKNTDYRNKQQQGQGNYNNYGNKQQYNKGSYQKKDNSYNQGNYQKSENKSYGQTQQQQTSNVSTGYGNNANNSNNYNSGNKVNNYNTQQNNQQQGGYQKKSNNYNKGQSQSGGYSSSGSHNNNEQQEEVKTQKQTTYNSFKPKTNRR